MLKNLLTGLMGQIVRETMMPKGMGHEFSGDAELSELLSDKEIDRVLSLIQDIVEASMQTKDSWMGVKERILAKASKDEQRDLLEFSTWFIGI